MQIKEFLNECRDYLAHDDLGGVYKHAGDLFCDGELDPEQIGYLTYLFEKCGIDTLEYFEKQGYIPNFYCCGQVVDMFDGIIRDAILGVSGKKAMVFPDEIEEIYDDAFCMSSTPEIVDLRGITFIGGGAFRASDVTTIIIDERLQEVGVDAFAETNLSTVYATVTLDEEDVYKILDDSRWDYGDMSRELEIIRY